MSILVVGDAMLDVHSGGLVKRISPEAPVPVIEANSHSYALGAAANVAAQVANMSVPCLLAYKAFCSDIDYSHDKLENMCINAGIKPAPLYHPGCFSVTTKERVWAEQQQICRIDRENRLKPDQLLEDEWIENIKEIIHENGVSVVIFSDYDKGTLTDRIIQEVANYCKNKNVTTILDPKRHTYNTLENLTLIKPNNKEIEITNKTPSAISLEIEDTLLLNTQGKDGMCLFQNGELMHREITHVNQDHVVDVCGCGDVVSAFIGIGFYKNLDITESMRIASVAAAINTKYRGCHIISQEEIDNWH